VIFIFQLVEELTSFFFWFFLLVFSSELTTMKLIYAIITGNISKVKLIVKNQSGNIVVKTNNGYGKVASHRPFEYALMIASQQGKLDIVKYFIEIGIDYKPTIYVDEDEEWVDYDEYSDEQYCDEHESCDSCHMIPYIRTSQALYVAAKYGHEKVVRHLLEIGDDVHSCNDRVMKIAISKNHHNIINLLNEF